MTAIGHSLADRGAARVRGPRLSPGIRLSLESRWRAAAALAIGAAVVAVDLEERGLSGWIRWAVIAGAVALVFVLARGDRRSLGLVVRPQPSVRYWIRGTALIGAIVGGCVVIAVAAYRLWTGHFPQPYVLSPAELADRAWLALVQAPLSEEAIYRLLVCVPLVALARRRWVAIAASGAVFAALHFRYGNPSPDNFVAGYVLAWAYLRSESIAVPIVLHALGNSVALGFQLAAHAWLSGG